MYHQREMENNHKDTTVIPTVDFKDWPQILEETVEYICSFRGVDGNPINDVIRHVLFSELASQEPMCETVGSKYLIIDEEMIDCGQIIEGTEVADTYHEKLGPFTNDYMSDRKRVWDKLCAIFQKSEAGTY